MPPSIVKTTSVFEDFNFTITSGNATAGAIYTNNGQSFTVLNTIASSTTLTTYGTGAPAASGTLTKQSGTGDATLTFSSYTTAATGLIALNANPARIGWQIQNQDNTNVLYVLLGSGASTSVYHFVLKAAATAHDGTGGSFSQGAGVVYTGLISVASAGTPNYSIMEFAP